MCYLAPAPPPHTRDLGNPDRLGAKGLRGEFKLSIAEDPS